MPPCSRVLFPGSCLGRCQEPRKTAWKLLSRLWRFCILHCGGLLSPCGSAHLAHCVQSCQAAADLSPDSHSTPTAELRRRLAVLKQFATHLPQHKVPAGVLGSRPHRSHIGEARPSGGRLHKAAALVQRIQHRDLAAREVGPKLVRRPTACVAEVVAPETGTAGPARRTSGAAPPQARLRSRTHAVRQKSSILQLLLFILLWAAHKRFGTAGWHNAAA